VGTERGYDGLTPRERRFCAEYLIDLSAKDAALRAGYAPTFAAAKAHLILRRPQVKAVLD